MLLALAPLTATAAPAEVIGYGQFDDCPSGEISGAEWRAYDNGTLIVESGFIYWNDWLSPWMCWYIMWDVFSLTKITFAGPITAGESLRGLFAGVNNLITIEGLNYFNTVNTTNMSDLFRDAWNLTNWDFSDWDTRNVTNMISMFAGTARRLTDLDLSGLDTRNVRYMYDMFGATSFVNLNLSNWDVSNVVDMGSMFSAGIRNIDFSGWNINNSTSMHFMFGGALHLRQLTLGEHFRFNSFWGWGEAGLAPEPNNAHFTGYWQNIGNGTADMPLGEFVFTSEELMLYYDGAIHADTWVWQPRIDLIPALFIAAWYDDYGRMIDALTFNIDVSVNPSSGAMHYTPPPGNFDGAKIMLWRRDLLAPIKRIDQSMS